QIQNRKAQPKLNPSRGEGHQNPQQRKEKQATSVNQKQQTEPKNRFPSPHKPQSSNMREQQPQNARQPPKQNPETTSQACQEKPNPYAQEEPSTKTNAKSSKETSNYKQTLDNPTTFETDVIQDRISPDLHHHSSASYWPLISSEDTTRNEIDAGYSMDYKPIPLSSTQKNSPELSAIPTHPLEPCQKYSWVQT
ncbi:hypothetical protein Ancab_038637, partial [Ancistrocladus abbreviatus]